MKKWIIFLIIAEFLSGNAICQSFQQRTVDKSNIGITFSNLGTIGQPNIRNNPSGQPSMEYPINSGIEHLFEGGLWIGASVNNQTRVSTVTLDAPSGYLSGGAGFEFTPVTLITEKSSIPSNDNYSATAIAHQQYEFIYTDSNSVIPGTSIKIQDHSFPLNAVVDTKVYSWNYSFADFFVIFEYKITNHSQQEWDSVYLGMWTDLVVRNVNVTQDAGTAFYNKGAGGFIDSFDALYAFEVTGDDIDFTQTYGSTQFLGVLWRDLYLNPNNKKLAKDSNYKFEVNANFWNFKSFDGSKYGAPADDIQRYDKLRKGLVFPDLNLQSPGNKTQLLSAGPINQVLPNESFTVSFAFVAAKQLVYKTDNPASQEELIEHLTWSKRTYVGEDINENGILDQGEDLNFNGKLDRYILPEPPVTPKVHIETTPNKVDIYWDRSSVFSIDPISKKRDFEGYRLYRTKIGDDLNLNMISSANIIASWDSAGNNIGFNNGFENIALKNPITFNDDSTKYYFHYSIDGLLDGWQYLFILTAFDEGDAELNLESLESSKIDNTFSVFSGASPDNLNENEVGVYPNPFRINAAWDGTTSRTKKIYFYNLPSRCDIMVFTLSGDIVTTLHHDSETYNGEDIRWFSNYSGSDKRVFSGGEHAWDLLSENGQAVTQGLYLFTVKNLDTKQVKTGKFAILK